MRVVLFDVDGVLIHGYHARPEYRQCWDKNIERDFGICPQRFKDEFILGPFERDVIIGKRDLKDALSEALPLLGFHGDPQILIDYWLENDSVVNQELLEQVVKLKASGKVRLFIATNQEHNRARYLMNALGFGRYFENIFYSARLGVMKPDPSYFSQIENLLGLKPGDPKPIFFDDTAKVVKGAWDAGWDAVEFLDYRDLYKNPYIKNILA